MEIYIFLYGWSIILALFFLLLCKNKFKKIYILLNAIPMITVLGFRGIYTGADTYTYVSAFEIIGVHGNGWLDCVDMEYGYIIFNKIVYTLFGDVRYLFISIAGLSIGILCWFINKYSCNIYLSLIVFNGIGFFISNVNTIRQCLATSILLIALNYIIENKKYIAILFVMIAGSFHMTAYLFFPLVFLQPLNMKKIFLVIMSCVYVVFLVHDAGLMAVASILPEKYLLYIGSVHDVESSKIGSVIRGVAYIFISLVSIWQYHTGNTSLDKEIDNKINSQCVLWFAMLVFLSGLILCIQYDVAIIGRIGYTFTIFICLLVPIFFYGMGKVARMFAIPIFIIVLTLQFFYMIQNLPKDRIYYFLY